MISLSGIAACMYLLYNNAYICIISTDDDPGLRIESFAIIKIRGVSTKYVRAILPLGHGFI